MTATWKNLRDRRAKKHRDFCVQATNSILDEFKKLGVHVLVFGSLADQKEKFRENSDVDLCIMERSGVNFSVLEDVVLKFLGSSGYDLMDFDDLKPSVQEKVLLSGVDYVK
jgi:predicted nucleotidyltransferase